MNLWMFFWINISCWWNFIDKIHPEVPLVFLSVCCWVVAQDVLSHLWEVVDSKGQRHTVSEGPGVGGGDPPSSPEDLKQMWISGVSVWSDFQVMVVIAYIEWWSILYNGLLTYSFRHGLMTWMIWGSPMTSETSTRRRSSAQWGHQRNCDLWKSQYVVDPIIHQLTGGPTLCQYIYIHMYIICVYIYIYIIYLYTIDIIYIFVLSFFSPYLSNHKHPQVPTSTTSGRYARATPFASTARSGRPPERATRRARSERHDALSVENICYSYHETCEVVPPFDS